MLYLRAGNFPMPCHINWDRRGDLGSRKGAETPDWGENFFFKGRKFGRGGEKSIMLPGRNERDCCTKGHSPTKEKSKHLFRSLYQ